MIFLGIVLAAAAVAVGVGVVVDNTDPAKLTMFSETVPGITSQWHVFAAGAAVAIVFMSGMTVAAFGLGRTVRVRRRLRDLRDEHEESLTTLEMEKRHLQRELARARQDPGTMRGPGPAPGSVPVPPRPGTPSPSMSSSPFFDG
jgi:hypothetical protein